VGIPSTRSGVALRDYYAEQSQRIEQEFRAISDGRSATQARAALVDQIVLDLSREFLSSDPAAIAKLCLVALGGYGRRELFPYSDIDLLFLFADVDAQGRYQEGMRAISRALWDLRLRVSPTDRFLGECERFQHDNPEFNISVLDSRYLLGDRQLFGRLSEEALPHMAGRARSELLRDLSELTRQRHQKEGDTIFHLEPNLKNSPGGLRDYHVAWWVARISEQQFHRRAGTPEEFWPPKLREGMRKAFDFLAAARCFLHYRRGRDDNSLPYELQAEAASSGIGVEAGMAVEPADWMRIYFRHAQIVYGLSTQLLDEALPSPASMRSRLEDWKSRRARPEFVVVGSRLGLREPEVIKDADRLLSVFEYIANQGVKLSREAEEQIREAISCMAEAGKYFPNLWKHLRHILIAPHAAEALRAMHSSGLLVRFFPEFGVIDSLVMRDFYHHYTVDAHSFIAIENIHRLRHSEKDWERPFGALFSEVERPELLFLSLLFHDVGKGMPCEDHIVGSLNAVEQVFPRLELKPEEADTVRFLIRDHLAMSATLLRRDIFDPQTIRVFAEEVGTPERLKLLCLFTYADIRAVNPDALTPWKAQSLWQLYLWTANYMNRSLDEERFHAQARDLQFVERILPLLSGAATREEVSGFLEGLPRRYVFAHSPAEVATHFQMARQLASNPVQVRLERQGQIYALMLLATDRPFLFAGISGSLASWGMHIWKAEAFGNAAGIVVDTFHFTDPHKTLELNPSESGRLEKNIIDVLSGSVGLETLMRGRTGIHSAPQPKVSVPTKIHFDDSSSSHSTLMEIITQDRPGLLYWLSSAIAHAGCNIEVALIDTEGERAVDTFYLTVNGAKLDAAHQEALRAAFLT
jgi:[protein-PII] uridylyltransferase